MPQPRPWPVSLNLAGKDGRQFPHARHQRGVSRTLHKEYCRVLSRQDVTQLLALSGRLRACRLRAPRLAKPMHRAQETLRRSRRADGRAQFHHGLIEISGPLWLQQGLGFCPDGFPAHWQAKQAFDHARHVRPTPPRFAENCHLARALSPSPLDAFAVPAGNNPDRSKLPTQMFRERQPATRLWEICS